MIPLVGFGLGALTDFVGNVENDGVSSDDKLDEVDDIELFGLFHPTAAKKSCLISPKTRQFGENSVFRNDQGHF